MGSFASSREQLFREKAEPERDVARGRESVELTLQIEKEIECVCTGAPGESMET